MCIRDSLKVQSAKLYEFLAPQLLAQAFVDEDGIKYVVAAQEDCSAADARLLLNKLLADGRTVAAVVYRSGDRINFVLGSGGRRLTAVAFAERQASCSAVRAAGRSILPRVAERTAMTGGKRYFSCSNY